MRTSISAALTALAALAILTAPAQASSAECQAATVVAPIESDAWIDANSVAANKGSDGVLSVDGTSRALVRFSLPATVPVGCVVESARLRLYADSSTEGARVEAQPLASTWSESAVTWTNQPEVRGMAAGAWSRDGYMQWNVTAAVAGQLASHGFLLRDAGEATETPGGHGFYAREKGESPPELLLRFTAPVVGEPPPPAPPAPRSVACGEVLEESTLVLNDLADCPGDGLLIGAPRIIVDLGGHTIDGVGLGSGLRNEGFERVTVRNGTVTQFDRGVELLEETRGNVLEQLHVHGNEVAAIELFDAVDNEVRGNTVDNNGGGVLLVSGTRGTVVAGNTMTLNSGAALLLRDANGNRLEGNRVTGGGDLGVGLERSSDNTLVDTVVSETSDGGIEVEMGSHRNRVEGSHVTQSGDTGILVSESDGNELIANTTIGMSDSGISLSLANGGVVRGNQVSGNPGGLQIDGSSRNLIEANDASGGLGIGIELGGGSFDNALVANTTSGNAAQGIYVADEALLEPGNLLRRNTANENGSDGIAVAKGGHTLIANVTLGNRGWGVNAVGLNVAAGNVADGNGQVGQCLGIVCVLFDVTPPETEIDSAPDELVNVGTAVFEFSADDELASFECSLDGGAFSPCTSPRIYTGLADGEHEFRVRASDAAGNVEEIPAVHRWEIESTRPETTLDRAEPPTFEFSADEPATFECALDDAAFEPCTSPAAYSDLPEGTHRFQVRATDRAGNTDPTPASHAWTIETAPETTITSAEPPAFEFTAGEPATFECALDDAAFEPCTSPIEFRDLADGDHRFRVRATDLAGNIDPTPALHTWTIDTTPPETTIDNAEPPAFQFSANEPATFECALDDKPFEPCTSPAEYIGLAEGEHRLRVRATDLAGNTDPTPAVHAWTINTTAPETTIDRAEPPRFKFSADEPASFECALDDADFEPCLSPVEYRDLGEGEHRFRVRATDDAGNTDPTPATHVWVIDRTAPETRIDSATPPRFEFSADEPASFECSLDDAAFEACASPVEYGELDAGEHRFRVRATDEAGNTDPTPASHVWTVGPPPDTTAPETVIESGPGVLTSSTTAVFAFSSSEAGSTFACSLDQGAFATCASPRLYSGLAAGGHQLRVRATDVAGNTDPTPATYAWTIDTTAPETSIGSGPDPVTRSTAATFAFSANEAGAAFECSLDGAAFARCASPQAYSNLAPGSHQFRVRAVDGAGNVDASPAARTWTIDVVAPQTTITSATTTANTARFTFSAGEAGSTFECSLDGAPFASCTSPRDYASLSPGAHEFRVRATDPAGNADATPAVHTWTVQAAPACTAATVTAPANADSWVLQSSASSNYRNDSVLKVDSKNGANARVLIRFALPPIPAGCQVTGARLRLYTGSYKTGRTLTALRLATTWTEAGVNWNNQPATAGAAATAASGQAYREWQVVPHVQAMYTQGNHGFLIRDAAENGGGIEQAVNSREKGPSNAPQLVITFG